MQPDASYSHLRGRTRGPLPLLYHYARAGKTSRLVGRGWTREELLEGKRRMEWARMDRWTEVVDASGQTHLPLKQATRVETVFLQQQPARGV